MKSRPLEAELFHADRQTDRRDEANSRFSRKRLKTNHVTSCSCLFLDPYKTRKAT